MRIDRLDRPLGRGHIAGKPFTSPWPGAGVTDCCWLDDPRFPEPIVICQAYTGDDPKSGRIVSQLGDGWEVRDSEGAHTLRAEGSVYAAWLGARNDVRWSGSPEIWPRPCALATVGNRGEVAVLPGYDDVTHFAVYRGGPSGAKLLTQHTAQLGGTSLGGWSVRIRDGVVLWQDQGKWFLHDLDGGRQFTIAQRHEHIHYAEHFFINGELYLLEVSERLTFRKYNETHGHVVESEGETHAPIGALQPDGKFRVFWSANLSESFEVFKQKDVDLTAPEVDLNAVETPKLIPINRPFLTASFVFIGAWKDASGFSFAGSVVIPITHSRWTDVQKGWLVSNRVKMIPPAGDDAWVPDDLLYGIYTGEDAGSETSFAQAVARARVVADTRKVGVFAYSEHEFPTDEEIALIRSHDSYMLKCYRDHGESDASYEKRISDASLRLKQRGVRTVLTLGWHRRIDPVHPDGLLPAIIINSQRVCSQVAARDSVFGVAGFRAHVDALPEAVKEAGDWFKTANGLPPKPVPSNEPQPGPTPVPPQPIPPGPVPGPEEPEVMPLPKIVTLRRKQGFVNIDPANGKTRENAQQAAADEKFEPQENIGAEKRVAFKHIASGKLFSVDSNGNLSSKTALGPDEQADVARGRYALWYNEWQGQAQVAASFVICDENGVPLPLR